MQHCERPTNFQSGNTLFEPHDEPTTDSSSRSQYALGDAGGDPTTLHESAKLGCVSDRHDAPLDIHTYIQMYIRLHGRM